MGKVVKIVAGVVGVAALLVPGVGTTISGAIYGTLAGGAVGAAAAAALTLGQVVAAGLTAFGLSTAMGFASKALGLGPKPVRRSPASDDRLRAGLDPRANRKIVFGHTAAAVDVRYQEFTGEKQEYLNSVIALASHALHSIEEVWFDEKKAWDAGTGAIHADFAGYLEVTKREEGSAANAVTLTGSTSWTAARSRMKGLAYLWLRYKLTGNTKKAESPFATAVTARITVRVRGAKMYDPRLDSTVPGGSGSHRADNQATWAWVSDDVGRNPALQLLWYLLGWRIDGKLAVGLGLPPARIDMASFMAAANLCDEPVTLAAGGTEPRYRADGVFGEGDDPSLVFENLCAAMNGVLRDAGGRLVLEVLHNDLSDPDVVELTADDVIGDFTWLQTPPIDQDYNVVRGRYVDASDEGLYQMPDYPEVAIASADGIERPAPQFDMPMVQSPGQAQRLAKQYLQRAQYPGTFSAEFLASAWRCQVGRPLRLTFPALGFDRKLFRVAEHTIRMDGTCPMVLREENAAIYAWDHDERPAVSPAAPIAYDPLNEPWVQAAADWSLYIESANDRNPLIPDTPGGMNTPSVVRTLDSGNVSVRCTFTFTASPDPADKNSIDFFELGVFASDDDDFHTMGTSSDEVWTIVTGKLADTSHAMVFLDDKAPNKYYTFAVRALRKVHSDIDPSGWIRSPLRQLAAPFRPAAAHNYTGNIGGVSAAEIAEAAENFNQGNDRNALTPPAATGVGLSSITYPDSTAALTVNWTYTHSTDPAAANNIDGFLVGLRLRTSSAGYSYNSADDGIIRWESVEANLRTVTVEGKPANYYYTAIVIPYRRVDLDVAATGIIKATAAQSSSSTPHQPSPTPNFTGKLDGETATNIKTWSGYAKDGLNSDGTVRNAKVLTGSILDGAINEADWVSQGATITLGTSDGIQSTYLSADHAGERMIVQFILDYQVTMASPDPDDEATFTVRTYVQRIAGGAITYSDEMTLGEVWTGAVAVGSKKFGRRTVALEYAFDGLTAGAYSVGYQISTNATCGVTCRAYRYLRADDKRADQ